jgi:hypothetical protein
MRVRLALILLFLTPVERPLAAPFAGRPEAGMGAGARTLLLYANSYPAYTLADGLESLKLRLQRVSTRVESVAVSNAASNQVAGADYLVVYCPQCFPELPRAVLQWIVESKRPLLWIGFGADQLAERAPFKGQFEVSAFAAGSAVTNVSYQGRDWAVTIDPWIPASLVNRSDCREVISRRDQVDPREAARPICWTIGPATFFLAEPSTGTVGFLFEDLLLDFYKAKDVPPRRVFVRIEDYHCRGNHHAFRRMVDYLYARRHPFMVGVIPTYRDPVSGEVLESDSQPEFIEALRYAQRRGGRLVLRGLAQAEDTAAAGAEALWNVELDRPPGADSVPEFRRRLQDATRALLRHELLPLAWETPQYAASMSAYPEIARVFSTAVERVQLSDATGLARADVGGLTVDRFGRLIVPENLGYVPSASDGAGETIEARARLLTQLRGTVSGCFIHAYQPIEKLMALVETLESFHLPFLDLAELDNRVETPEAVLLTGEAQATVPLRNASVRWTAYNRDGRLLAQKEEPAPTSGERTFKRTGSSDCEVFQIVENQNK